MASQDKVSTAGNSPNPPAPPAEPAVELEPSPTGLYIKDKTKRLRPLQHTLQEIIDVYNAGGVMSIYGIIYPSLLALPEDIRAAINEVSAPAGQDDSPAAIKARIAALTAQLQEKTAAIPVVQSQIKQAGTPA